MLTAFETKKRWSCPTDRELVLRAKLNIGWSNHTPNVFMKPKEIEMREMKAIEDVIQRAKDLERLEVERVGRMICKLENMTVNALGDGRKTCSMCGINFGLFRSSHVYCVDCGKAVCEKCRVDTLLCSLDVCMLCKICSENREVWKKSGGWFYGKLPTLTETCLQKCVSHTSGSPSPARAFSTWSHRARDIVRLQSFEPPEENHNDHSQYTSWTINLEKTDLNSLNDSDRSDEDETSDSSRDCRLNSIPDIYFDESTNIFEDRLNDIFPCENSKGLHTLENSSTLVSTGLKPFRKRSLEQKQLDLNHLSVQNTKLSSSCPSLVDLGEPSKLRRKPSIRRKRSSEPIHGKLTHK